MIFFLVIWSLSTLGFFSLAASMSKHQKQYFGKELLVKNSNLARLLGWTALILSLAICLSLGTPSNNISYWFGALSFAALFSALCTSYIPQYFKKVISVITLILLLSILGLYL